MFDVMGPAFMGPGDASCHGVWRCLLSWVFEIFAIMGLGGFCSRGALGCSGDCIAVMGSEV